MTSPATVTDADGRPIQTVGWRSHRPRAAAPGHRPVKLNGRTLEEYFPNKVHQQLIREPFVTLEKGEQYDVVGLLKGGGVTGQAGALRLGIARALIEIDLDDRPALKKAGHRDPGSRSARSTGSRRPARLPAPSADPLGRLFGTDGVRVWPTPT